MAYIKIATILVFALKEGKKERKNEINTNNIKQETQPMFESGSPEFQSIS
jgi:hypothetical protein